MKHQSITVRILDRNYPLLVQSSDEEAIRNVAEMVNQRMETFKDQYPDQPDLIAAVFTALELAEELLGAKETSDVLLTAIDRETDYIGRELTLALKDSDPNKQ